MARNSSHENVLAVHREMSADLLTPVSAYLRLSREGRAAFLLESVEGGERIARYSYLGVDPVEVLRVTDGELWREAEGRSEKIPPENPLVEIGRRLGEFRGARGPREGLPPFTGGAVGYVGYESVRFLEKVPVSATQSHRHDARLMIFGSVVAFDHVRQTVILIANVFLDRESRADGERRARRELASLEAKLREPSPEEVPLVPSAAPAAALALRPALGRAAFMEGVGTIKKAIRRGDIFQCVLSDAFDLDLEVSPFRVYRALRRTSPSPYLFHLDMGDEVLLGASPEMLTKVEHGLVETCPIAGTRPRGRDETEDKAFEKNLLASVKERAEHLMLVDLGRNDIGRVAKPGSVRVREFMQVHRFSHVMHLVSFVEGRLPPGRQAWDALLSCFPAGTLTGAPKIRAMDIIAGLERRQRGPYGGAVIYHDFAGNLNSCIAIRSLHVQGRRATLRAGAGIVADSKAAAEYDEIQNKTRALRRALEMALSAGKGG